MVLSNDPVPFLQKSLLVAAGLQCPLPYNSSINPDNRVEIHADSRVDSAPTPSVCVRSSVGISPETRHRDLLTQTWPFALNPRILHGSLSASRQHLRSPPRFTAPQRKRGGGRGVKRGGREGTVRQLFAVVLSSYFTRKHSHSILNSSSWPVSNSIWNAFLPRMSLCPPFSLLYWCKCLKGKGRQFFHSLISDRRSWSPVDWWRKEYPFFDITEVLSSIGQQFENRRNRRM